MLRPHPEGLFLRGAGDGERSVPDARGREHGAENGRRAGSVPAVNVETRAAVGGLPRNAARDCAGGAGHQGDNPGGSGVELRALRPSSGPAMRSAGTPQARSTAGVGRQGRPTRRKAPAPRLCCLSGPLAGLLPSRPARPRDARLRRSLTARSAATCPDAFQRYRQPPYELRRPTTHPTDQGSRLLPTFGAATCRCGVQSTGVGTTLPRCCKTPSSASEANAASPALCCPRSSSGYGPPSSRRQTAWSARPCRVKGARSQAQRSPRSQ